MQLPNGGHESTCSAGTRGLSLVPSACGCDKIPNQWGVDVRRGDKPMARERVNWIARIALDVSPHNLASIINAANLSRYNPRERHIKDGERASVEYKALPYRGSISSKDSDDLTFIVKVTREGRYSTRKIKSGKVSIVK